FFSSRRRHTRFSRDWSSDVCSSDLSGMSNDGNGSDRIRLHESWKSRLLDVFASPTMLALRAFLRAELAAGKVIYPPPPMIFAARSEERRVGKGGRSRWASEHERQRK